MSDRWPRIDALFQAALERSPAERPAFLRTACQGDEALRLEVESLLDHEPDAASFLERSALHEAADQLADDARQPRDPQIPGYTLVSTLGEGGMGVVYLAEQAAPMNRLVALKVIKHGMDSRRVIARFGAERQALARMRHPHIAAVFDAGSAVDGRPYFAMEYVDGIPITDYCDRARLSTRDRLALFSDVCGAVQHAHQKGVIHRDIKPSNVLVADDGGRPVPKIIDFGVAKAIERQAGGTLTEQGMLVGTPEYMSPEQAALSLDIDTSTDVYSLGVLLYELLVGVLPFDPAALRAAGYDEMRRLIREADPPKPSARLTGAGRTAENAARARQTDAGRLTRELKGDLDWIVLRALEKDRRHRYPTVAALATDVAHYLVHEPVTARPPSATYRVRKFARRYRAMVIGGAAVLTVLVAGLTMSLVQYARAEAQRAEADRQRVQAESQRTAAESAAGEAATERNLARAASAEASRQTAAAIQQAAAATDARREAEYRLYASNIVAADGELRLNRARDARDRLLSAPPDLRGWEWQHLFLRTDTSLRTLQSTLVCAPAGGRFRLIRSDNTLTLDDRTGRLTVRRCDAVDTWDAPAFAHAESHAPGQILAIGRDGAELVVRTTGAGANARWTVEILDPVNPPATHRLGPFEAQPICADVNGEGTRIAVGFMPTFNVFGEPQGDAFEVWDVRGARRIVHLTLPLTSRFDTRVRDAMSCMVAFSPDSSRLATSGGMVHVWQAESGVEVFADREQAGSVGQPIAWSPDGTRLAIGRPTGLVDVVELNREPRLQHFDGNGRIAPLPPIEGDARLVVSPRQKDEVLTIAFAPDGTRIVTGTDTNVGVWDATRRTLTGFLWGHDAPVVGVAIDRAGQIASADVAGTVKIWPPAPPRAVVTLPGAPGLTPFDVSADGAVVGVAEPDGGLFAWHLADLSRSVLKRGSGFLDRSRPLPPGVPTSMQSVRWLALSPDGRSMFAVLGGSAGTILSWPTEFGIEQAGTVIKVDPGPGCEKANDGPPGVASGLIPVRQVVASPDGRSLALLQGRCLVVVDLPTSRVEAKLPDFNSGSPEPGSYVFLHDGSLLVVNSVEPNIGTITSANVRIWDWRTGAVRAEVPTTADGAWRVTASSDGSRIALYNFLSGVVSIWDGGLRGELSRFPVPPDTKAVALSPDGHRLASVSADMSVRIWDVDRRQLLLVLTDDDHHSGRIAFTADGRLIASRASGGLTIWDSQQRRVPTPR